MNIYINLALILLFHVVFWFLLSIYYKKNDIADVAWGVGFLLMSWSAWYLSSYSITSFICNVLVSIWALRLTLHIYLRNKGKPEDFRYANWRKQWKHFYTRSFHQVFLLQGFFLFLIAIPIIEINNKSPKEYNDVYIIGVVIWLIGFLIEAIADKQLKDFKQDKNNKGKIITTGLWKYSRHPNYFGEVVLWWGIFIMSASFGNGYFTVISPLLITYLICFVSGIPMLEEKYKGNLEFEEYKKRTSAFFPLPPKK
jgi:steroid 5-alpha reductase family enzyme